MSNPVPTSIAVAAANEGIPVAAIARITATTMSEVYEVLYDAQALGHLIDLPKPDWPPRESKTARMPCIPLPDEAELTFACTRTFKLTKLEVGFLIILLKQREVDKTRLHHVVEQQRASRQSQPDRHDETDPKMVDVIICKLRKKLKVIDGALKIDTIWGGGYCIAAEMKPRIIAVAYGETHAPEAKIDAARLDAANLDVSALNASNN